MAVREDLGLFAKGDPLPAGWLDARPNGCRAFRAGTATFSVDCEVTHKDGWLRVHALEPAGEILRLDGWEGTDFHFCNDMRLFDHTGRLVLEVVCAPGARTRL